jgi:hypothetical protein
MGDRDAHGDFFVCEQIRVRPHLRHMVRIYTRCTPYTLRIHLFYTTTRAFEPRVLRTGVLVCFAFFHMANFPCSGIKRQRQFTHPWLLVLIKVGVVTFGTGTYMLCYNQMQIFPAFWKVVKIFQPGANICYLLAISSKSWSEATIHLAR